MRLHWSERGQGSPAVLLHGFTGSGQAWPPQLLDALARRHRLIIVDLPGHGQSPLLAHPEGEHFRGTIDAVGDVLTEAGATEATWIGYSMGGRLALGAAVLTPGRVSALVLESASPGLRTERDREARVARDRELAASIERDGVAAFVERWMAQPMFKTQARLTPSQRMAEQIRRRENRADGLAAALRGSGTGVQPSFWAALSHVPVPTLLITGEEDPKFTDLALQMAAALSMAHHVVVPRAGHAVHLERPEEWTNAVAQGIYEKGGPA